MNYLDRRGFLERAALSVVAWRMHVRAPLTLRLGFIEDDSPTRAAGIALGVDEAKHSAAMFGGSVELRRVSRSSMASDTLANVFVGAGTREQCVNAARAAAANHALFVNIGCTDDALRGADCARAMFHVAPSDAMLRDAVAMARGGDGARAAAWDKTLEKYGADTLNDRFRESTRFAMDEDAWLAWVSVKILWEAVLRARSVNAEQLAAHLVRDTTQFDGHKGRPLSFRAWDHQLRQPLYVVAGGARPIEVPPPRDDESSRESLDRLGTSAAQSACHLS